MHAIIMQREGAVQKGKRDFRHKVLRGRSCVPTSARPREMEKHFLPRLAGDYRRRWLGLIGIYERPAKKGTCELARRRNCSNRRPRSRRPSLSDSWMRIADVRLAENRREGIPFDVSDGGDCDKRGRKEIQSPRGPITRRRSRARAREAAR